jgi:hypothetical protein
MTLYGSPFFTVAKGNSLKPTCDCVLPERSTPRGGDNHLVEPPINLDCTECLVVWSESGESGVGHIDSLVTATRALVEDVGIDGLSIVADGNTLVAVWVVVWIGTFYLVHEGLWQCDDRNHCSVDILTARSSSDSVVVCSLSNAWGSLSADATRNNRASTQAGEGTR